MIAATIIANGALSGGGAGPVAPVAAFSLDSATGNFVGDTVNFIDRSTGSPTSWAWYVNGTLFSNMRNPSFYCNMLGIFSVTLTVANSFGSNTAPAQQFNVNS